MTPATAPQFAELLSRALTEPSCTTTQREREMKEMKSIFRYDLALADEQFVEVPDEGAGAIKRYPYGIRVDHDDFCQLLLGELQIWELLNLSASLTNATSSPAFKRSIICATRAASLCS